MMDPVALKFGVLEIRWYGIMAALGFLSAVAIFRRNRRFADMSIDQVYNLTFIAMIAGIFGARLFFVVQNFDFFQNNLLEIIRIDHGGLVFYGGLICSMVALIVYCLMQKLDFWSVLSLFGPSLALGHAFGRLGCFLNGCCYGLPTQCPWGFTYPAGTDPARQYHDHALHPVQLYEVAGNLVLFAILQYLLPKTRGGQLAGIYMVLYGIIRFADEFFRGDYEQYYLTYFTPAQLICFGLVPVGVAVFIYSTIKGKHGKSQTVKS